MADNVAVTAGTGTSIASDDIGGVHYQRFKLAQGEDGVAVDVSSAAPLYVHDDTEPLATFKGRASTYRTVGRAGTVARRLLTIWNPVGSGKNVYVNALFVDFAALAAMAVTVIPPAIRVYRITAAPTNGTVITKNAKDTTLTSVAGIEIRGDASADGTNSASALAATTTAGAMLTQEFFPRLITAAGYEVADRIDFLQEAGVIVRPGEGLCMSSDITLATQEPAGILTIASIDWWEA
ncbi:MAG: hypothetical protein H0T60_18640 [Acidobacteria bacterium]|nr:hypothetical protein [Acidobacteriota bacterium]